MHPFCCVSPVSDRNRVSNPATLSPPPPTSSFSSQAALRPNCISLPGTSRSAAEGIMKPSTKENCTNQLQLPSADAREVKINDIVGNGICGILCKWVNYGKGWRPRWFVLQDGVLSYYKIHGPDKIVTSKETVKGCKVIGEESFRRISKQKNTNSLHRRKPFGEIHLKISTIKKSRSDDKRFSIFTGTKRLYLRAESREDRAAWVDALQAVKDMFPRISNSELMTSVQVVVSTEKLRQRLQEEGVSESAIQESEQIMRNEFAALQDQLMLLKQKQWQLIDTLRHLEVHELIR